MAEKAKLADSPVKTPKRKKPEVVPEPRLKICFIGSECYPIVAAWGM